MTTIEEYQDKRQSKHDRLLDAAEKARQEADSTLKRAIFSDDPQAIEKLSDKIALLEKRQSLMVSANKLVKKNDREGLADLGFTEAQVDKLFQPDCFGYLGFPSYMITNNGANIRRLKQRQELLEKTRSIASSEVEIKGVKIADNIEDNRVQIFFPGKPSEEVRSELKSNGFKWAPSSGAWQRNYSQYASQIARNIVEKYY